MTKRPRLPLRWPAWLGADRIALVTVTAGGALASCPSVRLLGPAEMTHGSGVQTRFLLVLSTSLLSVLLVSVALRARSVARATWVCVLGGGVAGALNAGIVLAGLQLLERHELFSAIGLFFMGTLLGSFVGGPMGLLFGAAYALLVGRAVHARLRPSHAGSDDTLALSGAWLSVVALGVLLGDSPGVVEPVAAFCAALAGAVVAAVGLVRSIARRRWVRRVADGRVPGFAIVPRRMDATEAGLLPLVAQGVWDGLLVARTEHPADPYRGNAGDEPLALVTLAGQTRC